MIFTIFLGIIRRRDAAGCAGSGGIKKWGGMRHDVAGYGGMRRDAAGCGEMRRNKKRDGNQTQKTRCKHGEIYDISRKNVLNVAVAAGCGGMRRDAAGTSRTYKYRL